MDCQKRCAKQVIALSRLIDNIDDYLLLLLPPRAPEDVLPERELVLMLDALLAPEAERIVALLDERICVELEERTVED